jgi:GTPase SAR1 family protein
MGTPVKLTYRLCMDSHCRGSARIISDYLGGKYVVTGMITPAAGALDIFTSTNSRYRHLTRKDVMIVQGGSNDVYRNNAKLALTQIVNLCEELSYVNIIILDIPHRYDLIETSYVNKEIQVFNRKLRKVTKSYKHVKLGVSNNKEDFTRHGMHLNREGKRQIARQIAREIRQITIDKVNSMISLDWKWKIKKKKTIASGLDTPEVQ